MGLFSNIFRSRQKDVMPNSDTVSVSSELPDTKHSHQWWNQGIYDTDYRNLVQFKNAVIDLEFIQSYPGMEHDCGYVRKYGMPCCHTYAAAVKDGAYDAYFKEGAYLQPVIDGLSDEAFNSFADALWNGYYEDDLSLEYIRPYESELQKAGLITITDDKTFRYSKDVLDHIFYILYTFLHSMRYTAYAIHVERKKTEKERDSLRSIYQSRRDAVSMSREESEFYDQYSGKCERITDRIDNLYSNSHNPDQNVKNLKKKISMTDDLEQFCNSIPGGKEYFNREYGLLKQELQWELEDYLKYDYANDKESYEEELAERRQAGEGQKEILNIIENHDGKIAQSELKRSLSTEVLDHYTAYINALLKKGKILRSKEGNKVMFTLQRSSKTKSKDNSR